jgi:hypothetical protein
MLRNVDEIDEIFDYDTQEVSKAGTSRVGTLRNTSRRTLRRHFGEPDGPYGKVTYEWTIRFPDGSVATIYDYHQSNRHVGEDDPVDWSIGGRSEEAVELLGYLGLDTETYDPATAPAALAG